MTAPIDVNAMARAWLEYEPGEADDIVASLAALIRSAVEAETERCVNLVISLGNQHWSTVTDRIRDEMRIRARGTR
jgi:hypothetical protein